MQNKINIIFESMERDATLAETYEGNRVIDQQRREFYKATSKPMCLNESVEGEEPKSHRILALIERTIERWVNSNIASSTIQHVEITELDVATGTFKLNCRIDGVLYTNDLAGGQIRKCDTLELNSKCKMKLSSYFAKYFQPFLEGLNGDGTAYRQYYTQSDIVSSTQSVLKSFANERSQHDTAKKVWIYFTSVDIPYHYNELKHAESLSSCMSHAASDFGNKYGDDFVHPLEGYHYAPDFRLGLVSYHDPESIRTCTDYPFVGRVMVFTNRLGSPVAYSRFYGNENVEPLVRSAFATVAKPIDRQFYAVKADTIESGSSHSVAEYIYDYSDRVQGFLVAPYIDSWCNAFKPVDETTFKREDGREVMLMQTCRCVSDMSEDDFDSYSEYKDAWNLEIYYDTGIVQQTKVDGFGTYTLEGGEWVCGEQEW